MHKANIRRAKYNNYNHIAYNYDCINVLYVNNPTCS